MSEQTLRRILITVGVVVAAYGATVLLGGGDGGGDAGPVARALETVASADLDSVHVRPPADDSVTVRLVRGERGWTVNGHPADSARTADLGRHLSGGDGPDLASRNPANHARLGVDSAGARRLTFYPREGEKLDLLVGNRGPYGGSVYARVPGSPETYLVEGSLGSIVRRTPDEWRDPTIVAVDTGRLARLRVRRGEAAYTLRRADDGWRIGGGRADSVRLRRVLSGLADLEGDGFAPDTVTLAPPDRRIVAVAASGDTLATVRLVQREPGNRFYAAEGEGGPVHTLSGWKADRVAPARSALRARPDSARPAPAGAGGG